MTLVMFAVSPEVVQEVALLRAAKIREGFRIVYMSMKDATPGMAPRVLWESRAWDCDVHETQVSIPASILKCKSVAREIVFSSTEEIHDFRQEQFVYFKESVLERWDFHFGFVIPQSTNTWEQTIVAADEDQMIPADLLTGNVVIDTQFFAGDILIASQRIRVFYERDSGGHSGFQEGGAKWCQEGAVRKQGSRTEAHLVTQGSGVQGSCLPELGLKGTGDPNMNPT